MGAKRADLNPSLGMWDKPGPCLVVERIEDGVRNPALRHDLSEKVEQGRKLDNSEASKVYKLESERGGGIFRQMLITAHAQYRMDQRGITVNDLRAALTNYSKKLNDWKSQGDYRWKEHQRGGPIEWIDKKLGDLQVIFKPERGTAKIISTYWKGQPDPRGQACGDHPKHARTVEDMSNYRTFVKNPAPTKSDTGDSSSGKYPTQGLPSPPHSRSKPTKGPTVLNMPGESGSDSSGNIHEDKARTKGKPGGQYDGGATHPLPDITDSQITPHRRPGMTADGEWDEDFLDELDPALAAAAVRLAGMYPPAYPGAKRQREQKGRAYMYFHKRYMRKRGPAKMRQKRRHKRLHSNGRYKSDRERREDKPEKFKRRPGGGVKTIPERSQKQRDKAKALPGKSRQDKRPKRASLPIPFFHYPTGEWGQVIEVSPCGFIHFELGDIQDVADFDTFFDETIIDEDRLDDLFDHMDEVFEFAGGEDAPDDDEDAVFDSWMGSGQPKVAYAGFRFRRRPQKRRRKQRGIDKLKAKQRYRQNRMKSKVQSKKRYKRLKKNPAFKKQQQVRRKHPERFKMRRGEVLTAPEIAFALDVGPDGEFRRTFGGDDNLTLGYLRNISGMTGLVHFYLAEPGQRMLRSMPVRDFLVAVAFLSDEDMEAAYTLIDAEVGIEAYGDEFSEFTDLNSDLVNLYIIESDFMHTDDDERNCEHDDELVDPQDDDFYYGAVNKLASEVISTFMYEKRPPIMDPDTVYDRADDHEDRTRRDRKPGDVFFGPHDKSVEDSNPGSKVYPGGKDHVQKTAALIREIRDGCGSDLVARSEGLQFKLSRADQKNAIWSFTVQGSKGTHRVRLKAIRKGNIRDIQKTHVKVSCSCPFWQWQGPEFHAKQGDYLYGKPRGLATKPGVKDPKGQHMACKHVLAVLGHVTTKQWSVPKQRRMAHYLADTLRLGEMVAEYPEFESSSRRVAARYLASLEVRDA
jgi:hypothetical protein